MSILAVVLLALPLFEGTDGGAADPAPRRAGKRVDVERALVVGTTAPRAIHAGVDVLERGGSAVDAALTTALLQTTLCAGCWVSFAGRLTALVYDAESGRVVALNACYDVPLEEDDPLSIPSQPTASGRTALVPGFMAGVGALHERFGVLPFDELFEPSIRLAEGGFEMTPGLARLIRGKAEVLLRTEGGRRVFLDEDGELHAVGASFRQPDLARTLRRTADEGWRHFYTGAWAERFVATVRAEGGKVSMDDLARYRPTWQEPVRTTYCGTEVHGLPLPNRGGSSAVLALNLAAQAAEDGAGGPGEHLHRTASIERALAVAWSRRGRSALRRLVPGVEALWDESFADVGAAARMWGAMESPVWKEVLAQASGEPSSGDHSDAIVAVDARGNVVAMIHTINTVGWGTSGIFVDGVSIPDSGAAQQGAMAAVGPGGRLPDHGVPLLGTRAGEAVFASSATGSGNVQASWQNAIQVLGRGRRPDEVVDGPHLYAGRVRRGEHADEALEHVRERGFPLEVVEQFGGFEKGYWIGATIDPEDGRIRAACVSGLDGTAVGY